MWSMSAENSIGVFLKRYSYALEMIVLYVTFCDSQWDKYLLPEQSMYNPFPLTPDK